MDRGKTGGQDFESWFETNFTHQVGEDLGFGKGDHTLGQVTVRLGPTGDHATDERQYVTKIQAVDLAQKVLGRRWELEDHAATTGRKTR